MNTKNKMLLLTAMLLPLLAFAQNTDRRDLAGRGKVGTTGMQFLKIGVGARAVGMGEAFVALANDVSAVYYNPAGLTLAPSKSVLLTHIEWPADISYEFAAATLPVGDVGVFGAFVGMLGTGDQKRTVPYQGWTGEYFSANDWLVGVSYARRLSNRFSFGANVKYITEFLGDDRADNFAIDLGTLFDVGVRGIKLGMNITNFGGDAKYHRDQFALPINFRLGAIVEAYRNEQNTVLLSFEGSHPNDNVEQVAVGVEYNLLGNFALRTGYRTNVELEDLDKVDEPFEGFSFGAGANFRVSRVRAQLDYAYSDLGFLDNAQRFSLIFKF